MFRSSFSLFVLAALFIMPVATRAASAVYRVENAVMRVTPAHIGSATMQIDNPTPQSDVLTGAAADWAERIELHHVTTGKDGVMSMQQIDALDLPAKSRLILASGTDHLMIFGIKDNLKPKETRTITLHFKNAGDLTVPFIVQPLGEAASAHHHMMMP